MMYRDRFLKSNASSIFPAPFAVADCGATPLARAFNNADSIYLVVELPGGWKIRNIEGGPSKQRYQAIDEPHSYYGEFINTVGCLPPAGDLDADPVLWDLTQQLTLP
jgi:hypothetical protein